MKYNVLKRVFNLISAILGIIFASFYIIMNAGIWGTFIDFMTSSIGRHRFGIAEFILLIVYAVAALVFAILYLVISSKLCRAAKKNEDGTFDKRNKKNAGYIVFMFLSGMFFALAYILLEDSIYNANNINTTMLLVLLVLTFIVLALHITYMALPSAVVIKEKPKVVVPRTAETGFGGEKDEISAFFKFTNDLKTLLYEKTITEKEFVTAFDRVAKVFKVNKPAAKKAD